MKRVVDADDYVMSLMIHNCIRTYLNVALLTLQYTARHYLIHICNSTFVTTPWSEFGRYTGRHMVQLRNVITEIQAAWMTSFQCSMRAGDAT